MQTTAVAELYDTMLSVTGSIFFVKIYKNAMEITFVLCYYKQKRHKGDSP